MISFQVHLWTLGIAAVLVVLNFRPVYGYLRRLERRVDDLESRARKVTEYEVAFNDVVQLVRESHLMLHQRIELIERAIVAAQPIPRAPGLGDGPDESPWN